MKIELDELDKDFLSRSHSQEEWRREHEAALLRCASYWRHIEALRRDAERLREEVRVLRLYGNKDCTAMADAALKEPPR